MCGIFGVVDFRREGARGWDDGLSFAVAAISPRGPDEQNSLGGNVGAFQFLFAHSRLSVIDTSAHGRQPMRDASSGWSIAYNGEIYNYLEVRQDLQALGWSFEGRSDTEVLLKAWIQWGPDAVHRLNGMFAFAAINQDTGELWLVRDRFGVKPLLWGRLATGGIVFSSSVAAVARLIDADVDVAYCALGVRYKAFELPSAEAPFKGVGAVSPGGWLKVEIRDEGLKISEGRWYDLKAAVASRAESIASDTENDLLTLCRHLLEDAVHIRLRSDVPLAVSLSSGVDSSTIAAIASRRVPGLQGFTYGSPNAAQSEGPLVAALAKSAGITVHYIWPSLDAAGLDALLERTLACQEAPFPGLSVLAQNEVFRTVRQAGIKVLLGGQGGDEAFAGYRKFFVVAVRQALASRDQREVLRLLFSLGLMLSHEIRNAGVYWQSLGRYRREPGFAFRLLDWASPCANLWGDAGGSLATRQIEDIQRWSMPSLLRYEDRNSMGYGVETRLPFMDYRLVELALALPMRLKIANGYGKWALRRITAGVLPDAIRLKRVKRGFDVTQSWIEGGIAASLRERIQAHKSSLTPHLRKNVDYDAVLSDEALQRDGNLLDEALMLAWLAKPLRDRAATT